MTNFDPVSYLMGQKAAGGGGGGSSSLSGLTDVDISNPTNGQTLVYNATSGKWENGEGGGGSVLVCTMDLQTTTLDHTWQEIHDAPYSILKVQVGQEVDVVPLTRIAMEDEAYLAEFTVIAEPDPQIFYAASPNDYPSAEPPQ